MRLGVNFIHDAKQPLGFNADAVRALRPELVRFVVTKPEDLTAWIDRASLACLRVLWNIPVEAMGRTGTRHAARIISTHGRDVTAGIEFGFAPWASPVPPAQFLRDALLAAEYPAFTFDGQIAGCMDGDLTRARVFTNERPLVLGTGFDARQRSSDWLRRMLVDARKVKAVGDTFHAIGVSIADSPRPMSRRIFPGAVRTILDELGRPVAVTRVGWQLGTPLTRWTSFWSHVPIALDAWTRGIPSAPRAHVVTPDLRRRWLIDAYRRCRALGASHFILEPEILGDGDGSNRWPLYDAREQRPDPVWQALAWHHRAASVART